MSETLTHPTSLTEILEAVRAGDDASTELKIALRGFHKGTMQYSVYMPYPFTAAYIQSAGGKDDGHYEYGRQNGPLPELVGGKKFSAIPDKPFVMKALGTNPRCRILVDDGEAPAIVYNGSVTYTGPEGLGAFLLDAQRAVRRIVRYTRLDPSKPAKVEIRVDGGPGQQLTPDTDVTVNGREIVVGMELSDGGGVVVSWKP